MALHELNKRSCTQKEFPSLLQAINCYFPDSDYPTHVYPRVQAQMSNPRSFISVLIHPSCNLVNESRDVDMPDAPEVMTIDDIPRQTFSHVPGFNLNMVDQSQGSITSFNPSIINYSGPVPHSSSRSVIPSSTSCTSFNPLFVPAGLNESRFASVSVAEGPTFQPGYSQAQQLPSCQFSSSQQLNDNFHPAFRLANAQTLPRDYATAPLVSQAMLPTSCSGVSTGSISHIVPPRVQNCSVQTPILQDTIQQSALVQLPPAHPLIPAQQQYVAHPPQLPPQQHVLPQQLTQQLTQKQLAQQQTPGSLTDTPSLTSWNPTIICFKEPEWSNTQTVIAGSAGDGSYCPTALSNVAPAVRLTQITEVEESPQEPVHEQALIPTTPLHIYRPLTPAATPAPPSRADRVETWRREVTPLRLFDPVKAKPKFYVLISSAKDIKTQIKEAHGPAMLVNLNQAILAIQEMRRKVNRDLSPTFYSVLANTLVKPAIGEASILKGKLDRVQSEILAEKGRLVSESLGEGKWHGRHYDGASSVDMVAYGVLQLRLRI
ncbi:uncharacterized protein NECHADRAFT_88023 [Fusarium vanettenii 77-13-4]|uniref:Uncharacterized protein n=1 Tax=Fusarium vanettenii (strain ATCC MYA-4622 / CBS 123669 / FGSC 9596 / NRRL 45880 / 77-13-4) TaxID=660122 RepID=C7ZN95_FUSV7|nr:uncharacterized protein NECHADRAFT_88023 [Fusarium vanettenii 77-13-4]EEU34518.1 predicted protein [Fusarium vanettenii 77-13-4]